MHISRCPIGCWNVGPRSRRRPPRSSHSPPRGIHGQPRGKGIRGESAAPCRRYTEYPIRVRRFEHAASAQGLVFLPLHLPDIRRLRSAHPGPRRHARRSLLGRTLAANYCIQHLKFWSDGRTLTSSIYGLGPKGLFIWTETFRGAGDIRAKRSRRGRFAWYA